MKTIGIIVEYNPLHNGHIYHFNSIKASYPDSIVIACMSGYTSARGEISVVSKETKTRLALEMGVDLVIELPFIFTNNNADIFAKKSIEYLSVCGVNTIIIGSEENKNNYDDYVKVLHSKEYNDCIKNCLKMGVSYKAASQQAFETSNLSVPKSNDVLGIFYYKAIKDLGVNIKLQTIKRTSNEYLDKEISITGISSATSIRACPKCLKTNAPSYTYKAYKKDGFLDNNAIFPYLKYQILTNNHLENIALISEGFDNLLIKSSVSNNLDDLKELLTNRRYTTSRVNRILLNTLFNVDNDSHKAALDYPIDYVRVLGFNGSGQKYLNSIKDKIKIYTNIKNGLNPILDIEMKVIKTLDTIYNKNYLSFEIKKPIIY